MLQTTLHFLHTYVIIEQKGGRIHMAQLLAGGIIALGLLILASSIFIASREKKVLVSSTTTSQPVVAEARQPEISGTSDTQQPELPVAPEPQQSAVQEVTVAENVVPISTAVKPTLPVYEGEQSYLWWQQQLHSLTAQLQYLREHARDVERQIAILSEIAALAAELEMLQRKRNLSSEGKISLFPLQVRRQPTDTSYVTDKRPAVRKYTIEALS